MSRRAPVRPPSALGPLILWMIGRGIARAARLIHHPACLPLVLNTSFMAATGSSAASASASSVVLAGVPEKRVRLASSMAAGDGPLGTQLEKILVDDAVVLSAPPVS